MKCEMDWTKCSVAFVFAVTIWYFSALPKNIYNARKTGLPIVIRPVLPSNLLWIVFATSFQLHLQRWLPATVWNHLAVTVTGWEFRERWKICEKYGSSFIIVTPGGNEVWTADPSLATDVLQRRKDFLQLETASRMMSIFGPNVSASNGDEWQRLRKLVAPTLNERIMNAVWDETRSQAAEMLEHFANSRNEAVTDDIDRGVRMLTINVIGLIAFGTRSSWTTSYTNEKPSDGFRMTFIDALLSVANNFIVAVFVPTRFLRSSMMPIVLQKLAIAVEEFPRFVRQSIHARKQQLDESTSLIGLLAGKLSDDNLSSSLPKSRMHIREDEIIGNLFNFTIAGYDTTANTILYAFLLLALEPSWQAWVTEEVDQLSQRSTISTYAECFPLARRCLAFLYETLRLYTPVLRVTRHTDALQNLGPFRLPQDSLVFVATGCIHASPEVYAPDPLAFRPTRWLRTTNGIDGPVEEVVTMPKGTFLPWSDGPRHCPGTKMSQVEFVATLWQVLSTWQIELALLPEETREGAAQRIRMLMAESQPRVALQLRNPKGVHLRFARR